MGREGFEGKIMLNLALPGKLLERIDDFRFRERFPSRAEAVRWLVEYALKENNVS